MKRLSIIFLTIISLSYALFGAEEPKIVIKEVDPSHLCMNKNLVYKKPQGKVKIKGKYYYYCCSACYQALTNFESPRYAIDPISKEKVNKADAFTVSENRKAVYFKNRDNAKKYAKQKGTELQ